MPRTKPSRLPWDTRAADVLSGRAAVDPGELIDLIHEVNPTGRGRAPGETAARYALKSRLQSLLCTRFPDDLEVTPQPGEPGVVALRHRYRRHDACHAVVSSLDDDARSWVQRQLDLAAGPASAPEEDRGRPPPESAPAADDEERSLAELLAAGEEAQAAYDYERAGQCFSRAVAASGGGVEAAAALLGFHVDLMAADGEALAVEARLPAATLADPRVGLLLALAAARAGDEPRALRLLGRSRDPRAAEVRSILARAALAAGDVERAARHHQAAAEHDPAHPDLRVIEESIARTRAAERAPREARLAALLAAGEDAEALAEAQAILGRWPESETARRASQKLEERQREAEGRRHLAEAEEALARGEAAIALACLSRALLCPLPAKERERALARAREAEAQVREREVRAQVDQVVSMLIEAGRSGAPPADLARALGAYAELDPAHRAGVHPRVSLGHLGWLDLMPAARRGGRVRASVEAVLALARASSLVDKDPAGAAALVAAHDRLLDEVPLARSIEARGRAAAAEERARRAAAELHDVEEALAGGHLARARAALEKVDPRALPEGDRPRLAAFSVALAKAEEQQAEIQRFERLRAAGAFRAARSAARTLGERDGGADRARWAAEAEAIADLVRTRFAVRVDDLDGGPELLQNADIPSWGRPASAWVADGARELVLVNAYNAWMFFRFIDLDTGRVKRGVRIALDEPMYETRTFARPDGITIVGTSGLFEIALPGGELVQRLVRNWNRDRGTVFSEGAPVEGTRLLWASYDDDDEDITVRVQDLDGEAGGRVFPGVKGPLPVVGADPPRMVLFKVWSDEDGVDHAALTIHDGGGLQLGRADARMVPDATAVHPSGAGLVVLGVDHHYREPRKLRLHEISDRFEVVGSTPVIVDVAPFPIPSPDLAPAQDAGLVFVLATLADAGSTVLVALESTGAGRPLRERYRVEVPPRTTLCHDQHGRRAFALVTHPGGLSVTELGPEPPAGLPDSGPIYRRPEPFQNVNRCGLSDKNRAVYVYIELRGLGRAERAAAIARMEEERAGDPAKMVELVHALLHGDWLEAASRVLARVQASHPDHPEVRITPFAMIVARRAWAELVEALDRAGPSVFEGPFLDHYHHLLATAHARLGNVDEAIRHLTIAEASGVRWCHLRLQELRRALDSFPGGVDDLGFDCPASAQLVAILRAADAHVAEGDPRAAIAVLERPLVWDFHEVHSLSRLAAAYLALDARTPEDRFRKALVLARFVDCLAWDNGGNRAEGLAPGLAWSEDRIHELQAAAIAWLEADQGTRRAPSWLER